MADGRPTASSLAATQQRTDDAAHSRSARVSKSFKLWHGAGSAGQSVQGFALGFLFIYYNQVLGLSGSLTGASLAIAVLVDAVSDPVCGSYSDSLRSRWGRRHPFMLGATLPIGVLFVALFSPPAALSEFGLFLWFTTFNAALRTALTFYNVPYLALGAEVSQDYVERTRIATWRGIVGEGSALVVAALAWNFAFVSTEANPAPQLSREPYLPFALVSALVIVVFLAVSAWRTMDVIPRLPSIGRDAGFRFARVFLDLFEALKSVPFRALFLGSLVCTIYWGTTGALALHLKTFFWELDTLAIQWWHYAGVGGGIAGLPFTPLLNRLLDKKWTVILGVLVCMATAVGPVLLHLAGGMPADYLTLTVLLAAFAFLSAFAIRPVGVTVASMMGDMADEHELRKGTRQEGVYFAAFSFSEKCTGAVGPLVAGFAIDLVGLDPASNPGEVPGQVLFDFGLIYAAIGVFVLLAVWVFWPYNLDRQRHSSIVRALAHRRAGQERRDLTRSRFSPSAARMAKTEAEQVGWRASREGARPGIDNRETGE